MKLSTRLLFIAALFALALPFVFAGNASAVVYNPDGLVLNGATGLWQLPSNVGAARYSGCYDGTTTISAGPTTRFACYSLAVSSRTTQSACVATGTTPTGWNATAAIARWSACSIGGYSANSTNTVTDCVTNGGVVSAFSRCNRGPAPATCTTLPGFTWVSTGSNTATYGCYTTGMNATTCAGYTNGTLVGSYNGVANTTAPIGPVGCYVFTNDATTCTALTGTISTTNTDETRGFCGANWIFKAGTVGDWGSSVRNNCVKCHNPSYMTSNAADVVEPRMAGEVSKYANASHKNASRKIVAGQSLANVYLDSNGSDEHFGIFPYMPAGFANTDNPMLNNPNIRRVDWVNGKIEDTTSTGNGVARKNLPTGVYTQWYWEFGYYGEDPERGVYNGEAGSNGKPSAKLPACLACHATNWQAAGAVDLTKEPGKSLGAGIYWNGAQTYTAGSRPGVVNFIGAMTNRQTNVKTTSTYGNWDEMGVVCSRCHNAAGGSHTSGGVGAPNPTNGYTTNAVCGQCHIRAGSGDYAVTAGLGNLTARSAVGTGHPNWHETDFLNSPHARFTGTYGQVSSTGAYSSAFMTNFAGCVGCHNPHGSVREALIELTEGTSAAPLEGIEETCDACHAETQGTTAPIESINHPEGEGTPVGSSFDPTDGCVICHMPGGRHLFRITLDTNYTTTQPAAFTTKPDGAYTEAVWLDMKLACGQCHITGTAPHFSTAELAGAAKNMHGTTTEPTNADCLLCHEAGNDVGAPKIIPGVNHHGLHVTCAECHPNGHGGLRPNAANNAYCMTCHSNTGAHAVHHVVATLTVHCNSCHVNPGVLTAAQLAVAEGTASRDDVDFQCLRCHASPQGSNRALIVSGTGDNHHRGSGTSTARSVAGCLYCHAIPMNLGYNVEPVLGFGNAETEAMQDRVASDSCSGACHASSQKASGTHHTGAGLPLSPWGDVCMSCHVPGPNGTNPGAPGVTDPAFPPETWANCTACHALGGTYGPSATSPHHSGLTSPWTEETCKACHEIAGQVSPADNTVCLVCHGEGGITPRAIIQDGPNRNHHAGLCGECHSANPVMPNVNHAITVGTSGSSLGQRVIDQTLIYGFVPASGVPIPPATGGCLICHSTAQTRSADGSAIGAIVPANTTPTGTDDNHHRGHAYINAVASPTVNNTDPGVYCLGCHGSVADNGATYGITGSGLPTALVSVQKGMLKAQHQRPDPPDATSILCVQCHSETDTGHGDFIQKGLGLKNHHPGACVSCHKADGSSTNGTFGAGVGTITATGSYSEPGEPVCTICHIQRINAATFRHPYKPDVCVACHTAPGKLPVDCLICHTTDPYRGFFTHASTQNQPPTGCEDGFNIKVEPADSLSVQFKDHSVDPGGESTTLVRVSWGDGTKPYPRKGLGGFFNHTYANPGTYTIEKTVKDKFLATCIATREVTVPQP